NNQVKLWASEPPPDVPEVQHSGVVTSLRFTPDGTKLFIASAAISGINGGLEILDLATSQRELPLGPVAELQSVYTISPDMRYILLAHDDHRLALWDLASARERWRSDIPILWASWSQEPGRPVRIVAQTPDRDCKLVDPDNGRVVGELAIASPAQE